MSIETIQTRSATIRAMVDRDGSPLAPHEVRVLAEQWKIARAAVDAYSWLYAAHLSGAVSPSPDIVDTASQVAVALPVFFDVDRETVFGQTARLSSAVRVY